MRRVVVTGIGLVTPVGNDVETSFKRVLEAQSGVRLISKFPVDDFPVKIAAEVNPLEMGTLMDVKEARRTTDFVKYAVKASHEALAQAGLLPPEGECPPERHLFGTSIGVGIGGIGEIENSTLTLEKSGPRRISPFFMPYAISNMAAGVVSRLFGLKGPNICTTTACTSGTHGVGEGFLYIRSGMADVMIAGGAEAAISPLSIGAFASMKALSTHHEDPSSASRPFDLHRDGFVMGEGAGVLVLEEYEHARKRGATILAEMVGYGMSGDAHHITAPAPEGEGAQRCMSAALKMAQISGDSIDYINAHGTSTDLNDKYETAAIKGVFGTHAYKLSISSTKGVTGHCLGAAGGIEAALTVLAISRGVIPPTANLRTPDPVCDLDYTPLIARERSVRYALSNSFGFGGTNGTVIFKKFS
jgi:3-oxoacyl-[acyl-carrier-protein] synthase II